MTLNVMLLIGMVIMYACGVYMLLERSFTRMILAVMLVGNATNILIFLTSGSFGDAPIMGDGANPSTFSDPLPQAFILTAIVITFATTAFMLALLYRSWRLAHGDEVDDDDDSISLRDVDPEEDDEVFDEDESGDTEFGEGAEAAIKGARTKEELDAKNGGDV
ncbi:Na(+)/H(+) antiporter subunit C [Gulosibacter massiliensis]|uniref:Na(+)/H(+) antiporter subunit C n=1 Tax=Gulosibacter massiliensis TaxID=2479839 RepID=UPI000F6367AA|nr:Na(+)/H(+) antiporter subunit C [Gulosibacter massiliensis]